MTCPTCGTENRAGRRFCSHCGTSLALACPACGAANEPDDLFCGECGTSLTDLEGSPGSLTAIPARPAPSAERRLVSVLFADLVGFTTLSEHRDAEEVRDLLSRYFETCQQIIGRYGGVVEKFIGDAVMAVWGTPIAQEDDAERAVRAALDLTAAVSALGVEVGEAGAPGLQARAGVLTGEAAVNIGAEGQGMVAGDLVNTASRIQSVATPGTVLVGDVTRRASEAAIAYDAAGSHELKGKAEPVPLWRAVRVVGGRKGALRTEGLEAPFVGRDRELRMIRELFHASADEGKAHLVSAIGVAGVGKSRLSWEFEKYIDGLADEVWWHRGRCLAYGEGVAYWALAEMVRSRAGIVEGEEPEPSLAKLRTSIEELVTDPEERRWVEPRLAHLVGLEERTARDQADLFSAWRLFFERMADQGPVEMVFEDLQWADASLLDFIEYLLEWSKDHPLFILTLARPDLTDRRPSWGAGKRNFTSLFLEPLSPAAMEELMRGLVPGLPDELRASILERAEGIPLYAVETVRMLLDRGLLQKEGSEYHPTGRVEDLEVPETLQALIAARLDGVAPEERRLLQDAAVLGKTFTKPALSAVTGLVEIELEPLLSSLVRKEFLSVQADPRSPERGQYGFLQDLVRKVAYDTISLKERKARHLAVAEYLQAGGDGEEKESVEVVAAHYLEAYRAAPEAADAGDIRTRAREALVRAGEHAAALAADEEAQRSFEQAAELTDDPHIQAALHERAGRMAYIGSRTEAASAHFERAVALYESVGATHPAAGVMASLGEVGWDRGRFRESLDRMEDAFGVLSGDDPDEDLATLAAQLARFHFFAGETDLTRERVERALEIAEALRLPEVLSQALNTKSLLVVSQGRREESAALLKHALEIALENDLPTAAMRAYYNLGDLSQRLDRYPDALAAHERGLALCRRLGDRYWEMLFLGQSYMHYVLGEWDQAVAMSSELPPELMAENRVAYVGFLCPLPLIHVHRGEIDRANAALAIFSGAETSGDVQERAGYGLARTAVFRAEGRFEDALRVWEETVEARAALGPDSEWVRETLVEAVEAALALGDTERAEALIATTDGLQPGDRPPSLEAHRDRLLARVARARGDDAAAEAGFERGAEAFRRLGIPFWTAVALLERAEGLDPMGRADAAPLVAEAREVFERLRATPWLERAIRFEGAPAVTPDGSPVASAQGTSRS